MSNDQKHLRKTKKILFLSHYFLPKIGGIEIISEILAKAFVKAGHTVRVLTWTEDPAETQYPFEVIRQPSMSTIINQNAWADIIFENNPCIRLGWPSFLAGKPTIVVLHTWITNSQNGNSFLASLKKNIYLKRHTKVVAVSKAIAKKEFRHSEIVENPYRQDDFKIIPGISRDKDFIFLGRLVSDKGADLAIRAFKMLLDLGTNVTHLPEKPHFTIIGDGPELQTLKSMVEEMHINSYVSFRGSLQAPQIAEELNRHKYLLIPSLWEEPFGVVALEGLACGCIPISSNGGGLPEAIGPAGYTFESGNVDSLVSAIVQVNSNISLQNSLRQQAHAHLLKFDRTVISRRYIDMLENL